MVLRETPRPRSLRRLLSAVAAGVAAMLVAAPAWAGQWSWKGTLYPQSGGRDGVCIWYPSRSSCSGGNHWDFHVGAQDHNGWYVKVLVGFENNQRIRGVWLREGESVSVEPQDLGMCCYVKAVATHWEGGSAFLMRDWALAA